jgi:hypothetical protein
MREILHFLLLLPTLVWCAPTVSTMKRLPYPGDITLTSMDGDSFFVNRHKAVETSGYIRSLVYNNQNFFKPVPIPVNGAQLGTVNEASR